MPTATAGLKTVSRTRPAEDISAGLSVRGKFLLLQGLVTIVLAFQFFFSVLELRVSAVEPYSILSLLVLAGGLMVLPARIFEPFAIPEPRRPRPVSGLRPCMG